VTAAVAPISFATADVDEACGILADHFYANVLDILPPAGPLAARFDVLPMGPVTLGNLSCGTDVRVDFGELGAYHVDLPLSGHLSWRQGPAAPELATESRAAVFQPVGDTVVDRWTGDSQILAVKIERTALESQLEALLGLPARLPLKLAAGLDVARGPGRTWARLVRMLAGETESDGLLGQPMVVARFVDAVITGLLLAADHPYRDQLARPGPACAPQAVRDAVDAIHAHPERPFTPTSLAALAGTSVRTLQERFRHHVGAAPMAYLRDVRLARAHADLRAAAWGSVTVAEVAYRWGFTHLGRFSAVYRVKYGRPPGETLRGQ
jgi:AraC-like DNA-binding protein